MRRAGLLASVVALTAVAMSSANAFSFSAWLAAAGDATGTPITNITTWPGNNFSVSLWIEADVLGAKTNTPDGVVDDVFSAFEFLLGFDRSTSAGTTATPIDLKIAPNGTVNRTGWAKPGSAVTFFKNDAEFFTTGTIKNSGLEGGFAPTANEERPYGWRVSMKSDMGWESGKYHIADITFTHALNNGESYNLVLFDAANPDAKAGSTFIAWDDANLGTVTLRPGSQTVQVNAVPEPASMIAVATGLVGLLGIGRRRRTK